MSKHVATSREYSRNSKSNDLIAGLLFVVLGLVIVYCGAGMINTVVLALGILLIIFGVLSYAETKIVESCIALLVVGLIMLILGFYGLAAEIVRIVVGVFIILAGLGIIIGTRNYFFIFAFDADNKVVHYIVGALVIVLGVMALINYYDCFGWIIRIIGVFVIVVGALNIAKAAGLIKN